jgi:hypothetical protein
MCINQTCLYNNVVGPEMHSSGNSDHIFENKAKSKNITEKKYINFNVMAI